MKFIKNTINKLFSKNKADSERKQLEADVVSATKKAIKQYSGALHILSEHDKK